METMTLSAQPDATPAKAGLTVPLEAFDLFIDLDLRGFVLVETAQGLRVGNKPSNSDAILSADDRLRITKFKPHLLALVAYCRLDH